jgi:hypothetical protein
MKIGARDKHFGDASWHGMFRHLRDVYFNIELPFFGA